MNTRLPENDDDDDDDDDDSAALVSFTGTQEHAERERGEGKRLPSDQREVCVPFH